MLEVDRTPVRTPPISVIRVDSSKPLRQEGRGFTVRPFFSEKALFAFFKRTGEQTHDTVLNKVDTIALGKAIVELGESLA